MLGEEAIISITPNKANNFEFEAEIVNTGKITSQSKGTSYKQVLCAMFDLSILKVYADKPFFKFVYHDGILEGLDDRKKIQSEPCAGMSKLQSAVNSFGHRL